jgi:hypothetical protein
MASVNYNWSVASPPPSRIDKTFTYQDSAHPNETAAEFKARILAEFDADWDAHPPV